MSYLRLGDAQFEHLSNLVIPTILNKIHHSETVSVQGKDW